MTDMDEILLLVAGMETFFYRMTNFIFYKCLYIPFYVMSYFISLSVWY